MVNRVLAMPVDMSKRPTAPVKKIISVAVRLDPDTKAALNRLAREDERTISDYIRRALRQHVEREQARGKGKA